MKLSALILFTIFKLSHAIIYSCHHQGGDCLESCPAEMIENLSYKCPGTSICCILVAERRADCDPPVANEATLSLIEQFEGFSATPSSDPTGNSVVGFGHHCKTRDCSEVHTPMMREEAVALLKDDLKVPAKCVSDYIVNSVRLNDNQLGALTSWAFNVGCGSVRTSMLVKRLNAGQNPNTVASQELPKWNRSGGRVLPGLTRRRQAEVKLFHTPSSIIAHPTC